MALEAAGPAARLQHGETGGEWLLVHLIREAGRVIWVRGRIFKTERDPRSHLVQAATKAVALI